MKHIITQYSMAGALLSGYNNSNSYHISQLVDQHNFGLGTFNQLDGEMVMIHGKVYRTTKNGETHRVSDSSTRIPFAVACNHSMQKRNIKTMINMDMKKFEEYVQQEGVPPNSIASISIQARFKELEGRAVCKVKSHASLLTATNVQSNFMENDVSGYLIGFCFPDFMPTINVPGLHLHFISDDRTLGGHVTGFYVDKADVIIHIADRLEIILPHDKSWKNTNIPIDPSKSLAKAERKRAA